MVSSWTAAWIFFPMCCCPLLVKGSNLWLYSHFLLFNMQKKRRKSLTDCTVCVCTLLLQSCPALCDTVDCSLPGSSVHGIILARILECFAISSSRGSSQLRDPTCSFCITAGFFTTEPPGKPLKIIYNIKNRESGFAIRRFLFKIISLATNFLDTCEPCFII